SPTPGTIPPQPQAPRRAPPHCPTDSFLAAARGVSMRLYSQKRETTGLFGVSRDSDGDVRVIAMPGWATIPSNRDLATGRRWHFFFAWLFVANGLVFVAASLLNGHLRRDLLPERRELGPSHVLHDIWNHVRLRLPKGEAAKRYNVLQKVAYLGVGLLLIVMVLTGLTMSPGMNASMPWM
ncbi:MAG: cytochrome b/b6 domain-containing protein, partial [Rhodospirillaceae bacterium]